MLELAVGVVAVLSAIVMCLATIQVYVIMFVVPEGAWVSYQNLVDEGFIRHITRISIDMIDMIGLFDHRLRMDLNAQEAAKANRVGMGIDTVHLFEFRWTEPQQLRPRRKPDEAPEYGIALQPA